MAITDILSTLEGNPYFGAGAGLVGIGAGLAGLKRGFIGLTILFRRNCMITMEIPCRDKSYGWLLQWITKNASNTQHMSVETSYKVHESGKVTTNFDFVPSVGIHFFNYKSNWIRVERNREQQTLDLSMGIPYETVTLTTLGRNKKLFLDILDEARDLALTVHEGKTVMYTAMGHEWREFGHARKRRPIGSVVLDSNLKQEIISDIQEFLSSSKWYENRGIPYRRGYLLHGPPGCGKTSFITALAGFLEYSIAVLNLSDAGLTDDRLNHLMAIAPAQSIILLEDIDAAFVSREESSKSKVAYDGLNRVTFSGLLNMLDGVASSDARILFMTTNYLDRLDPALIRPGRVDVKHYIGYASDKQLAGAFMNFYPDEDSKMAENFVNQVRKYQQSTQNKKKSSSNNVSMAMVQGYFMFHKDDPHGAINNVQDIWKQ